MRPLSFVLGLVMLPLAALAHDRPSDDRAPLPLPERAPVLCDSAVANDCFRILHRAIDGDTSAGRDRGDPCAAILDWRRKLGCYAQTDSRHR